MPQNRTLERDWDRCPGLEEAAERGSAAAAVSVVVHAIGLMLTLGASNLLTCLTEERGGSELVLLCARENSPAGASCPDGSSQIQRRAG